MDISAKRGDILDRHGRVLAYSVDADSVYARSQRNRRPRRHGVEALRRADRLCVQGAGGDRRTVAAEARVRLRPPPRDAAAGDAHCRARSGRHRIHQGRPPVLSEEAAGGPAAGFRGRRQQRTRRHRGSLRQPDQRRARQAARIRPTRAAARSAGSSGRRPRARPSSSRSTSTSSTWPSASCATPWRSNRAAGGTVVIMAPKTGEILALANEPTFNPNTFSTASPEHRRNRAVQDIYEPGSTFKVVTASAAHRGARHRRRRSDRRVGRTNPIRIARDSRHARLRVAVVHRRDGEVEQRRRHQGRLDARTGAARPVRAPFRLRPRALAGLPR